MREALVFFMQWGLALVMLTIGLAVLDAKHWPIALVLVIAAAYFAGRAIRLWV